MVKRRGKLIVCALGYGYLSKFVFKRLCSLGIIGFGITSNQNNKSFQNIFISNRDKTNEAISFSSHLLSSEQHFHIFGLVPLHSPTEIGQILL